MLGFLQYIAPTLQLAVGLIVFNESLTRAELFGFVAVWIALLIFTSDRYRGQKSNASRAREPIAES
jgi:chloramphenicol-sensitive protein RarD